MSVTPINRAPSWRQVAARAAHDEIGTVEEFTGRFETHLRAARRSPRTIERYLAAAARLGGWLAGRDLADVGRSDMEAYLVWRGETTKGSTVATDFVSLQQLFKFVKLDLSSGGSGFTSPMAGMPLPRFVAPDITVIPEEFLSALIRQTETVKPYDGQDRTFEDTRDAAILRLFVDTGARLSEIATLTLNQVANAPYLTVAGKSKGHGAVPREILIGTKALRALRKYLRARQEHPQAEAAEVWLGKRGPMTPNGIRQMIRKRSGAMGMHVHPHMFRHTWAHERKAAGDMSDEEIMRLGGWESPVMLARYGRAAGHQRALDAAVRCGFPGDAL